MKPPVSVFAQLRGRRMHSRIWGPDGAPRMFMVHGWGDTSASFQFIVDALRGDWQVVALDWRGFGLSQWNEDTYWYPDYFADLDAWLDHFSPDQPVRLVGHSMGGTVASIFTGVRAARVARFVNLDGGGLRPPHPDQGPARVEAWLGQVRSPLQWKTYSDRTAFAARLMRDNPRLSIARAEFLAAHVTEPCEGGVRFAADPRHFWTNPVYYSSEDAKASWRLATARVLWIGASDSFVMKERVGNEAEYRARLACFRDLHEVVIEDSGHNLHHDQPDVVAELIEEFFA